ncbi:PIG-L family deacetylase [Ideonella azotifigens]|uniref:PIG-L family deacetylase n=1 Tax=Ideonella azotifigens TaxID=513160 RepID=A0ABP3V376_9BURK|nr:PIG-L family deacetylase [Ideonella azotifigens]MCD2340873.1 PIG-L family deacetylase [Ideonella azotifigens]
MDLQTFSDIAPQIASDPGLPERAIRGEGTDEATWLDWPGMARLPALDLATWLPANCRLVVVAPHPDDEVLACGGLLARHAGQGGDSLVIAVSDGEASHGDRDPWPAEVLGPVRRSESDAGLARLGVSPAAVVRLGLPDGQIARHEGALQVRLAALLRASPVPDLVISTWSQDGHPDHEACGRAAEAAARQLGCRFAAAPVWMWHWARPDDARVPWQRLHALPLAIAPRAAKLQALAAHSSQLTPRPGDELPVLGEQIIARAGRHAEFFFC